MSAPIYDALYAATDDATRDALAPVTINTLAAFAAARLQDSAIALFGRMVTIGESA